MESLLSLLDLQSSLNSTHILPFGVILASLIGSGHCMMMCGPIVAATTRSFRDVLAYNFGRGVSYTLAGVLAGYLGQWLDLSSVDWVSTMATIVIGLNLIAIGLMNAMHRSLHFPLPQWVTRWIGRLFSRVGRTSDASAMTTLGLSFLVGAVSVFLPCGWLYTALLAAISTGSWWLGGVVMLFFWIGSLPAMVSVGHVVQVVLKPVFTRWGWLANAVLVGIGVWFLMS